MVDSSTPWQILAQARPNLPQLMGAVQETRRGRLAEMMLHKQIEREERQEQTRAKATELYRGGKHKEAREEALFGGDSAFASQLGELGKAQRQEQNEGLATTLNMLKASRRNPQAYPAIRARAIELGIPGADRSPEIFDPMWADKQIMTLEAFASPQGQEALSTAGKIAADMGYRPGTPDYNAKVAEIWQTESTKFYPLTQGGGLAGVSPGQSAQMVITPNPGGYAPGSPVGGGGNLPRVTSPNEAMRLPPGTQFLMPDGRIGTVPGGPTPRASGVFPGN